MGVPVPTIPNEIITKILSNLGKNDLLKCRLVSQSWNELSLKILRNPKYGHEHELTQDNIQKFLEFSNGRSGEWVLPFYLNFSLYGNPKLYPQIPNYIQQLQSKFGGKCVGHLTLSHNSSSLESVGVLMSILTLIAPSLTHLDLSEFKLRYEEDNETNETMKLKEMLGNLDLNFPNLSKLKSCPPPYYWNEEGKQKAKNEIHSFLIKNSENLKELEVISPIDLLVVQKQIGSLKKLKIVKPFALTDLDIGTVLEPIRTSPTVPVVAVLKDLSLTYCAALPGAELDHQILIEFLSSFSTSLHSLTVVCQKIPENPFPRLTHLRFLRIQISPPIPSLARHQLDPQKLNLNSETFPALESMDISTDIYFESEDANTGNSKDDWNLPTVKNLIIRVTETPFNSIDTAELYVNHLQKLFPNVTSLTLVSESHIWSEQYLNELLFAFTQSDGAPKIQKLEIQNCGKNYLGQILNGLDPDFEPVVIIKNMNFDLEFLKAIKRAFHYSQGVSGGSQLSIEYEDENKNGTNSRVMTCKAPIHFKMTGLEKIYMSFSKEHRQNYGHQVSWQPGMEHEYYQMDLFLMSLPKHLPLLRQIDISQQMFRNHQDFYKQQIFHVQDKFPNLIINTTV